MSSNPTTIIKELRDGLQKIYNGRLKGLFLFGSYARGEEDSESDLDVLVVLDQCDNYGEEIDRTSQLTADLSLKHRVSISRVFVPEHDWLTRQTPFLKNVHDEAISA